MRTTPQLLCALGVARPIGGMISNAGLKSIFVHRDWLQDRANLPQLLSVAGPPSNQHDAHYLPAELA